MRRIAVVSIVSILVVTGSGIQSAAAQETESYAEKIVSVVNAALPEGQDEALLLPDSAIADTIAFSSTDMQVNVPVSNDDPVLIDTSDDFSLEISLPEESEVSAGELSKGGTVVYPSKNVGDAVAVQVLDDGVRIQTVIGSEEASETYTYAFGDGAMPVLLDDGSIEILQDNGGR